MGSAETRPDPLSFVDADGRELERYTYQSFDARTRELAAYLFREAGLRPGDRALLVYPPGLEMVAAFYACARIGVIAVPVSPPLPMAFEAGLAKLSFIARDCQAKAVLSTKRTRVRLPPAARPPTGRAALAGRRAARRSCRGSRRMAREDFGGAPVADTPGRVLFLQYTSGSTSDPKGVIVSHANVIANSHVYRTVARWPSSWLPQHHDMGLISAYLFVLVHGGTTHGMSPLDFLNRPSAWLRLISQVHGTDTPAPNFALEYCLPIGLARANRLEEMAEVRKRRLRTFVLEMFRLLFGTLGWLDLGGDYLGVLIIGIFLRLRPKNPRSSGCPPRRSPDRMSARRRSSGCLPCPAPGTRLRPASRC